MSNQVQEHTKITNPKYYMYILVNDDLKMSKGKIASQVGHVVGLITEKIIRESYESISGIPESYLDYMKWINSGYGKIILRVTQTELEQYLTDPDAIHIIDQGLTQIEPNSLTVVGFYPSDKNQERFNKYKLL